MSIIFQNNRLLFSNDKLAMSLDCCCLRCYRACFWVTLVAVSSISGGADAEPPLSPPLGTRFGGSDARIIYHGHAQDTNNDQVDGYYYHAHLWVIEYCMKPMFHVDEGQVAVDYVADLEYWANVTLASAWQGAEPGGLGEVAGQLDCTLDAINVKKSEYLVVPQTTYDVTDLLGPLLDNSCADCENI